MRQSGNRGRLVQSDDKALAHIAGLPAVTALFAAAPWARRAAVSSMPARSQASARSARNWRGLANPTVRSTLPSLRALPALRCTAASLRLRGRSRSMPSMSRKRALGPARAARLLLLDGVGNPHNLGAIGAHRGVLRTAAHGAVGPSGASAAGRMRATGLPRAGSSGSRFIVPPASRRHSSGLRESHRVIAAAPGTHRAVSELRRGDKPFRADPRQRRSRPPASNAGGMR